MSSVVVGEPKRDLESSRDWGAYAILGLMVLIGSSTATAAKFAVRELPVGLLPVLRYGMASVILVPLVARSAGWKTLWRQDLGRLLTASALCVPVNQLFFLAGTRLAPTSHVGLIYATTPLVVLILAIGLGQERFYRERLVGVLVTVAGALVIGLGNLWFADVASGPFAFRGDLLLIGAVGSWGGYLTVNKPLVARHGALPVLAGTFLAGGLLALPLAAHALSSSTLALGQVTSTAWLGVAYLGLIATVVGLACQNLALRLFDASEVATIGNAAPVLTIVWGIWLLGESLTPSIILGGALVLLGIYWTRRPATSASGVSQPVAGARLPILRETTVDAAG
jgi:drug/metabolite transporter (DMT)-like permease